jgi:16S rRNA G1207 methylase RsmC
VSYEPVEHYFSAAPAGDFVPKEISVRLGGQDLQLETAGGVFSPDHVDAGTEALLRIVPSLSDAPGHLLDLGCGWGPIALTMALEAPSAAVWAIDVNERALELTRRNAERAGCRNVRAVTPDSVPDDVLFTTIWSNPPIRIGKSELHELLEKWVPRLAPGGEGYFVVAKHLGADSLFTWMFTTFAETHAVTKGDHYKGFRVIEVRAI